MTRPQLPIPLPSGVYYGWVIVAVAWLANMVAATMNPVVFSIFIDPMRDELGLSLSGMAWAISIRMLTGGAAAPLMGRLIDSYGARWLGFFGGLISGGVLLSLYFVDNIWLIYALFAVSGISGFGTFGGQLLTIVPVANWFVAKRGRATSIAATGLGAGTAIGVPLGLFLINTAGWRWAWVVFGLAIWVVILPGYAFLMRRRPEDLGLLPDGRQPQPEAAAGQAADSGAAPAPAPQAEEVNWTLGQAMRTPVLWFILLALTVYMFSSSGVLFLRVPYWNDLGVAAEHIALGVARRSVYGDLRHAAVRVPGGALPGTIHGGDRRRLARHLDGAAGNWRQPRWERLHTQRDVGHRLRRIRRIAEPAHSELLRANGAGSDSRHLAAVDDRGWRAGRAGHGVPG